MCRPAFKKDFCETLSSPKADTAGASCIVERTKYPCSCALVYGNIEVHTLLQGHLGTYTAANELALNSCILLSCFNFSLQQFPSFPTVHFPANDLDPSC